MKRRRRLALLAILPLLTVPAGICALAGLVLFVLGSAACAAAPSIGWLTAARFLQALDTALAGLARRFG